MILEYRQVNLMPSNKGYAALKAFIKDHINQDDLFNIILSVLLYLLAGRAEVGGIGFLKVNDKIKPFISIDEIWSFEINELKSFFNKHERDFDYTISFKHDKKINSIIIIFHL